MASDDAPDPGSQTALQSRLDALQSERPDVPGFAIAVIEQGKLTTAATGIADPAGSDMTARTPFRIASVTKTFVAAAVLRLYEQGDLDLDAPIGGLIGSEHRELLESDGYDPAAITVRHLLMHSGGLHDHFGTEAGVAEAFADLSRLWSRTDQVALMVELTQPVGAAGKRFHYSDTGYVLLGEIIERVTGQPLAQAVRKLNRFEAIGTARLRWESLEGPERGDARAHQWFQGTDIFEMSGSIDAYGGGGLIGDVVDVARYFDALFDGKVFEQPETLELMLTAAGHPADSPYRLGLFTEMIGDQRVYMHRGFWGVEALHAPDLDLTIVVVALDEKGFSAIRQIAVERIKQSGAPCSDC